MTIADDLTDADIKETVPAELLGAENSRERAAWKYQRYMRDYLQSVQAVDDGVGRLLDGLDVEGLAENTIVVYTSDQGFFLGDHGWFDKRLMYEQSLGVPLVIRWPAEITAGTRCEAMITNVDFAATFLDMCGLDPDVALPHQQGRSFRVLLRGADVPDWPSVVYYRYWEHDDPEHHAPAHYGVRSEDFKYIVYYNDGLGTPGSSERVLPIEYELFDLRRDPAELHNVVDGPDYAAVRLELEAELGRPQDKYADEPYQGPQTPRLHWST